MAKLFTFLQPASMEALPSSFFLLAPIITIIIIIAIIIIIIIIIITIILIFITIHEFIIRM